MSASERIDRVLRDVSTASDYAVAAARRLERTGAEPHLVAALERADRELVDLHRRLVERLSG